jgi:hypothetical protein
MTNALQWRSCVEVARLVAERGSTLKTRGHQNICLLIQWKVMDEKPRISVGNQRASDGHPPVRRRMRTDHSCNSILLGQLAMPAMRNCYGG